MTISRALLTISNHVLATKTALDIAELAARADMLTAYRASVVSGDQTPEQLTVTETIAHELSLSDGYPTLVLSEPARKIVTAARASGLFPGSFGGIFFYQDASGVSSSDVNTEKATDAFRAASAYRAKNKDLL